MANSIGNAIPEEPEAKPDPAPPPPEEIGGPKGKEPTRYGDWESGGICRNF